MAKSSFATRVEAVRQFNRFYTQRIGILDRYLETDYALSEVRVIYELAHREMTSANELCADLALDAGYLSRIVGKFEREGLLEKRPSHSDKRQKLLELTSQGYALFTQLNEKSKADIGEMLHPLSPTQQKQLVQAMQTVQGLLTAPKSKPTYTIRPPQPGDMGWVVATHGRLYAIEYGWDSSFEGLVAEIVGQFVKEFDPQLERCWMAELDGEPVGSVFLVKKSKQVAKLRLLIVNPKARGLGIGKRLTETCIRQARDLGYKRLTLWTNSILLAARGIYENLGFELIHSEPHHSFGQALMGETWELKL